MGQGGHGRAGQGRAGQGRAGQGRAGWGRVGQGRVGKRGVTRHQGIVWRRIVLYFDKEFEAPNRPKPEPLNPISHCYGFS